MARADFRFFDTQTLAAWQEEVSALENLWGIIAGLGIGVALVGLCALSQILTRTIGNTHSGTRKIHLFPASCWNLTQPAFGGRMRHRFGDLYVPVQSCP